MAILTVRIDERTEERLARIGAATGDAVNVTAARLLERAAREARPRTGFDADSIRRAQAESEAHDLALADSASAEREQLLVREDVG